MLELKRLIPEVAPYFVFVIFVISVFSASSNLGIQVTPARYDGIEQDVFSGRFLNDSVSFTLPENTYSDKVHMNFTQINESRDFVQNGGCDSATQHWNSEEEVDVNYTCMEKGLGSSESLNINLTGKRSNHTYRPMNNSQGIENFRNGLDDDWYTNNNATANFTQEISTLHNYPNSTSDDGTGSLKHELEGSEFNGIGNSCFVFNYNSSAPVISSTLNFWYKPFIEYNYGKTNKLKVKVYLITPNNKTYHLEEWAGVFNNESSSYFREKTFTELKHLFNQSGNYTLKFSSEHIQRTYSETSIFFDYIELNITQGYKQLKSSEFLSWNQSINFDREVWKDGQFNLSYAISQKFPHINHSQAFLAFEINNNLSLIESIKDTPNNTWITQSFPINRSILNNTDLSISVGLYFNKTTHIFPDESFSIFFDNISCFLHTNPDPPQINLAVTSPASDLNQTFNVTRDKYGNAFANISDGKFKWHGGTDYQLNITSNSTIVIVDTLMTYFLMDVQQDESPDKDGTQMEEPINVTVFFFILLLMMIFSSFVYFIRLEKRSFIKPEYDYIKKLKIKRDLKAKVKRPTPQKGLTRCSICGKFINKDAKFCEHCGATQ
ncbi:MAG: zinc ribbon domain-containing protein [Promethearchaeia archaeon]